MGIHFWSVEVGFDEEKIVFAARKRFSGNTENVVGFEVLRKILRRLAEVKVWRGIYGFGMFGYKILKVGLIGVSRVFKWG